jgi:hypothetical protein
MAMSRRAWGLDPRIAPDVAVILAESRFPGPSQVTYELSMKILSRFPRAAASAMLVTIPRPRGGALETGAGTPATFCGGDVSTGPGTSATLRGVDFATGAGTPADISA